MLSQTLLRTIDYAAIQAIAVDTHGLAQRSGTLVFMHVSWQSLPMRLGQNKEITSKDILDACQTTGIYDTDKM